MNGRTCSLVWRALVSWVESQVALKQGAAIPNFGRFTWAKDPALQHGPLRPAFVVHEAWARAHRLARGPAPVDGAHSEELSFNKLALRFAAGAFSKDAAAACVRLLVQCVGETAQPEPPHREHSRVGREETFRAGQGPAVSLPALPSLCVLRCCCLRGLCRLAGLWLAG